MTVVSGVLLWFQHLLLRIRIVTDLPFGEQEAKFPQDPMSTYDELTVLSRTPRKYFWNLRVVHDI